MKVLIDNNGDFVGADNNRSNLPGVGPDRFSCNIIEHEYNSCREECADAAERSSCVSRESKALGAALHRLEALQLQASLLPAASQTTARRSRALLAAATIRYFASNLLYRSV